MATLMHTQTAETNIVSPEDIPCVTQDDGLTARVLIGTYGGMVSPAKTWAADVVRMYICMYMCVYVVRNSVFVCTCPCMW